MNFENELKQVGRIPIYVWFILFPENGLRKNQVLLGNKVSRRKNKKLSWTVEHVHAENN